MIQNIECGNEFKIKPVDIQYYSQRLTGVLCTIDYMFIDWYQISSVTKQSEIEILDHITESSNYHDRTNLQYNRRTDTVWISMGAREGEHFYIII